MLKNITGHLTKLRSFSVLSTVLDGCWSWTGSFVRWRRSFTLNTRSQIGSRSMEQILWSPEKPNSRDVVTPGCRFTGKKALSMHLIESYIVCAPLSPALMGSVPTERAADWHQLIGQTLIDCLQWHTNPSLNTPTSCLSRELSKKSPLVHIVTRTSKLSSAVSCSSSHSFTVQDGATTSCLHLSTLIH